MTQRDLRIDLIRGMGILMIALDHFGGLAAALAGQSFVVPFVTWSRLGWSSAAEFFVFYSGYLVGAVFMATLAHRGLGVLQARCLYRGWQIYVANLLTCCAALLLLYLPILADGRVAAVTGMDTFATGNDGAGLLGFLTLQSSPMFFEILHLYMAFLTVAAMWLVLVRASAFAAILVSGALWLFVQCNPAFNPGGWHFNPYAWQFVFVLGIVFSRADLIGQVAARFGRRRVLVASAAALAVALFVKVLDKTEVALPLLGAIDLPGIEKGSLGPLRLAHFLVSIVFISLLLPSSERLARSSLVRAVARVGRHSLECFCLSTLLVYAGAAVLSRANAVDSTAVLGLGLLMTILLCAGGAGLEWLKAKPWSVPRSAAANPATDAWESSERPQGRGSLTERSV